MALDVAGVIAGVLAGNVAAGARAIRWLDDRDPRGYDVIAAIFPHVGRAHVVGVTGPPGAGKSTLVDMLVTEWRARDLRVAVLAIDPTSPFSGGAILGDRLRMQRHSADSGVFIRSMASRGSAGGLSRASYDAATVLDAMGYDVVVVETVGVGQEEIDIVSLAHSTIIVNVPGLGDEVQAIKAGLLEAGDIFVLNKSDREGAADAERQLRLMLHLREAALTGEDPWPTPLLIASAARGEGGGAIVDTLQRHAAWLREQGGFAPRTGARHRHVFTALLRDGIERALLDRSGTLLEAVERGEVDPYSASESLLARLV